jgi:succinyl-CoA synthetase alpha subunit
MRHQTTNALNVGVVARNKHPQGVVRLVTESGEGTNDIIATLMCREHRDNRH